MPPVGMSGSVWAARRAGYGVPGCETPAYASHAAPFCGPSLLALDYRPANRHQREESERFRAFAYDELLQRDEVNLDICWLRDESLEGSENLPEPDVLAQQIVENLEAALEQFRGLAEELGI